MNNRLGLQFWIRMVVCGLALGTLLPVVAKAQTLSWKRQLGSSTSDGSYGVATDINGNVYISGGTDGSLGGANQGGPGDAWVAKYNTSGKLLWKRQLGTKFDDTANGGVATDSNGNVYISGSTGGSLGGANQGGSDAWVAKYNSTGKLLWKRQPGSSDYDDSRGVATDSNGNVYILILGQTSEGAWVAKYSSSGTLVWKRQLGTSSGGAVGVATDSNGNFYISGATGSKPLALDAFVAKYNSSGNLVWKRQLGTSGLNVTTSLTTDSNANVYISGYTYGSLAGANQGSSDAWVAKYNSSGNLVWKRQFGTSDQDHSDGVATDSNGNVYISGSVFPSSLEAIATQSVGSMAGANQDTSNAWVAKYNSSGALVWKRQLGTSSDDHSYGLATDSKGSVYISGSTSGSLGGVIQGSSDAWVAKYTQ